MSTYRATVPSEFEMAGLTGLTWRQIEGFAAEVDRQNGDVYYRDQFVCTIWNDENGGDMVDRSGNRMTDYDVQARINQIDRAADERG